MSSSGRPRYPDILTPRQCEVLDLIREGLTNEQIAERLGITLDGAKFHVSEILGRLGLSSREEATRWQPEGRRPWWASALALLGWPLRRLAWPLWVRAAGAAIVATAIAGVAVLVWGVIVTREPMETGQPTAQPRPTAPGTATADTSGWKVYRDEENGFEFRYPPDARLSDKDEVEDSWVQGRLARMDFPVAPGTNLAEKYVLVTARDRSPEQCSSPTNDGFEPGVIETATVRLSGLQFRREARDGVATGNLYQSVSYSTGNEGLCVSLSFVLHSTSPGNYPTPPPEFDEGKESQVFEQVASTFRWASR